MKKHEYQPDVNMKKAFAHADEAFAAADKVFAAFTAAADEVRTTHDVEGAITVRFTLTSWSKRWKHFRIFASLALRSLTAKDATFTFRNKK